MSKSEELTSGKGYRDENFPVASFLLKREYRAPIMAFYRFARTADDIADHPTADATLKRTQLASMRAGLSGQGAPEAVELAGVMGNRGLDAVHAHELLDAFEQDVDVRRYPDWEALVDYCRVSAMPVGRFVLDVHGECRSLWRQSDALCAALQVINHLQDCAKDYRTLDRIYLPTDLMSAKGVMEANLAAQTASPALRRVIITLARRTQVLLRESRALASGIRDRRLACEVAIIQRLAESLIDRLLTHDPLSERVHHRTAQALWLGIWAATTQLFARRSI